MKSFVRQQPGKRPEIEVIHGDPPRLLSPSEKATRQAITNIVRVVTSGYRDGPLRLKWERLSDSEAAQLIEVTRKGDPPQPRPGDDDDERPQPMWSLGQLSKREQKKWEGLVSKAAGRPGFFDQQREQAKTRALFDDLKVEMSAPKRRVALAEPGSVTLPQRIFGALDAQGANPTVQIPTLGVYAFVLLQLENAKPLSPGSTIEGVGDDASLLLDGRLGLGARFGEVARWKQRLEHLGAIGWLTVEHRGPHYRVSRGPKTLAKITRAA